MNSVIVSLENEKESTTLSMKSTRRGRLECHVHFGRQTKFIFHIEDFPAPNKWVINNERQTGHMLKLKELVNCSAAWVAMYLLIGFKCLARAKSINSRCAFGCKKIDYCYREKWIETDNNRREIACSSITDRCLFGVSSRHELFITLEKSQSTIDWTQFDVM